MSEKVLVIVPTYSNAGTLRNSLESIRNQSHTQLEIWIISDGASEQCISVAQEFCALDSRFSLDLNPKSHRRGEDYRDRVILASNANYVTYLADDDLFLPEHVETMLDELKGCDFVNPIPMFINRQDEIWARPLAIQFESARKWHLDSKIRNSISLSGVMHTKAAYLSLPERWATTPDDFPWTDLYMWRKFLSRDELKVRTASKSTILKFLGGINEYDQQKLDQNQRWFEKLSEENWSSQWHDQVEESKQRTLVEAFASHWIQNEEKFESILRLNSRIADLERENSRLRDHNEEVSRSWSWKLTSPLRRLVSLTLRLKREGS